MISEIKSTEMIENSFPQKGRWI